MKLNTNELYHRTISSQVDQIKKTSMSHVHETYNETGDMCSLVEEGIVLLTYNVNGPHVDSWYLHPDLVQNVNAVLPLKDGANPLVASSYVANRKLVN